MRRQLTLYGDRILGRIVAWLFVRLARADPDKASAFCGRWRGRIWPGLPAHRIGQANLRAAFPGKDPAWIEQTLREAWTIWAGLPGNMSISGGSGTMTPPPERRPHPDRRRAVVRSAAR